MKGNSRIMHIERVLNPQNLHEVLQFGNPVYRALECEAMRQAEERLTKPAQAVRFICIDERHALFLDKGMYYPTVLAEPDELPDIANVTFYRRFIVGEKRLELVSYTDLNQALQDIILELCLLKSKHLQGG
jgi:hypothetical protein